MLGWLREAACAAVREDAGRGDSIMAPEVHAHTHPHPPTLGPWVSEFPLRVRPSGALTYALPVLKEGQCPVPGIQVHTNDGALAKPRGKTCLVALMMKKP